MSRGLRDRFPYPYTRADGEAFLAGRVLAPGTLNLAIEIDGQACGSVGAQQGSAERGHMAELGYWLGQAYWGQGLMTRVVGLFAPWVMDELRLFRLQAGVVDFNLGSARVLKRTVSSKRAWIAARSTSGASCTTCAASPGYARSFPEQPGREGRVDCQSTIARSAGSLQPGPTAVD